MKMQPFKILTQFTLSLGSLIFFSIAGNDADAQSKPWPVPNEYLSMNIPNPATPTDIKDGKAIYLANCSPCHGEKGKGDGIAAASLNPKPADHTSALMLKETDGSIFYKISEGRPPMPTYKAALTDKQRWALVAYIRTLCKTPKK